jgi:hypothetical protein
MFLYQVEQWQRSTAFGNREMGDDFIYPGFEFSR